MQTSKLSILMLVCSFLSNISHSQDITKDTIQAHKTVTIADSLCQMAHYKDAEKSYKQAALLFEKHKIWYYYISVINKQGNIHSQLGNKKEALSTYMTALKKGLEEFEDTNPSVADIYHNIGQLYTELSNYQKAEDFLNKAIASRFNYYGDHNSNAVSYNSLGILNEQLGRYEKAIEYHKKAFKITSSEYGEDHLIPSYSIHNMSSIYSSLGHCEKAIENYQKVLQKWSKQLGENHPYVATTYLNIGLTYFRLSQYQKSLSYSRKGLNIHLNKLGKLHPDASKFYHLIASNYRQLKQYKKALKYHNKSLDFQKKKTGLRSGEVASIYNNMAMTHELMNNKEVSFDCYLKSLEINAEIFGERHPNIANLYINLGVRHKTLKQYDNALKNYEKALDIYIEFLGYSHEDTALSYGHIADIHDLKGEYSLALNYYQKAMNANDSTINPKEMTSNPNLKNHLNARYLLWTLKNKSQVLAKINPGDLNIETPLTLSLKTYQVADTLIQQMRRNASYEKDKLVLAERATQTYQGAVGTALQLYQKQQNQEYLRQAFYFSEQNKASVLAGALADHRAQQFAGIPDSLISLEKELKIYRAYYAGKLARKEDSALHSDHQDQLFQTNQRLDSLILLMEESYPRYHALKYKNEIVKVATLQKSLSPAEALITYQKLDSTLCAFVITNKDLQVHRMPIPADSIIQSFLRSTGDPQYIENHLKKASETYVHSATHLYDALLKAPLADLPETVNQLIIVPDGMLARFNFEILLSSRPSNTEPLNFKTLDYLLKTYAISYAPSATLYLQQQKSAENSLSFRKPYGGYAPSYEGWEVPDSLENSLLASRVRAGYMNLPNAQKEVEQIARLLEGDAWTGTNATEQHFKNHAVDYQILHLAMHTLLDDDTPMQSQFVFAVENDSINDGALTAAELYAMKLPAQFVVLSACETGYGEVRKGEGIMSLSRAFLYAGCPSQVVTLWKAPDVQSQDLMVRFFSYLKDDQPKNVALQQAKLDYLQQADEITAHPFYWAGFIPMGDFSPIPLQKSNVWIWILTVGTLLLLMLGFLRYRHIKERMIL